MAVVLLGIGVRRVRLANVLLFKKASVVTVAVGMLGQVAQKALLGNVLFLKPENAVTVAVVLLGIVVQKALLGNAQQFNIKLVVFCCASRLNIAKQVDDPKR